MNRDNEAIAAIRDALACFDVGQIDTAKALLVEATDLLNVPHVSGQAAHLASVMDAYELTSHHAHLGEFHQ